MNPPDLKEKIVELILRAGQIMVIVLLPAGVMSTSSPESFLRWQTILCVLFYIITVGLVLWISCLFLEYLKKGLGQILWLYPIAVILGYIFQTNDKKGYNEVLNMMSCVGRFFTIGLFG